jgi:beta-xylosidase
MKNIFIIYLLYSKKSYTFIVQKFIQMKNTSALLISLLLIVIGNVSGQETPKPANQPVGTSFFNRTVTYNNPLPVAVSDPYVFMDSDSTYYMYPTNGGGRGEKTTRVYSAYSTKDLVNWKNEGKVLNVDPEKSWCVSTFWAPCVRKVKNKYYMFYSAQWRHNPTNEKENFRIGVAVSNSPVGPFTNIQNKPLFNPGYPIIDADILEDNGRFYLYYSRCCYKHPVESELSDWMKKMGWFNEIEESWVYGVEITPDFSATIGEPVVMLRRSVTSHDVNRRWTEGSFTFKHGDTYYMMYSANSCMGVYYALGYATSKSPLGPFTKAANNPVVQKKSEGRVVYGTGHNSVVTSPDGKEMYCVYHGHTPQTGRVLFVDRMEILENGQLIVHGPTTEAQPIPFSKIAK